jgi:hypothetical protein
MANSPVGVNAWSWVGDYSDVGYTNRNTNASTASSYWLIAAYNDTMGRQTWTDTNDGFKLDFLKTKSLICPTGSTSTSGGGCSTTGTGNPVPEPTSLALVAAALLGAGYTRRRKRAA